MTGYDHMWSDDGPRAARPTPNRLAEHAGPFWTARRVRQAMGFSDDEMMSAIVGSHLLAVMTADAVLLFPAWQFELTEEGCRVKPALLPVFHILRHHERWSVAMVLRAPSHFLPDGRSAVEVADKGDPDGILRDFARDIHQVWHQGSEHRDD